MRCPGCGSKNIIFTGTRPFSVLKKFTCKICHQDFFVSPIYIPGNVLNPSGSISSYKDKLDTNSFIYGIPIDQLQKCPSCLEQSAYYIGISPISIECANKKCKFYKPYQKDNRYKFASDKSYEKSINQEKEIEELLNDDDDTKEIDPMDFSNMFP